MKKIFLTMLIGLFAIMPMAATESSVELTSFGQNKKDYSALPKITVYRIVQVGGTAWSKSSKEAYYDAQDNSIIVNGVALTIHENRAYGQENDGRADYRYQAGEYFFNL